jgi:hypothetical protein
MANVGRSKSSHRAQLRRFAKSVRFPRWIVVIAALFIGLVLWLVVVSDRTGHLLKLRLGSIFYLAIVMGVAALLAN